MSQKNLLLIVSIVLLFGGTGYFLFPRSTGTGTAALKEEETNAFEVRLLELNKLKDIKLDIPLLEDPFFRSLSVPAGVTAPEGTVGRPNPFLPIENIAVSSPSK